MCRSTDLFLAILAILFPPIAVWIKIGVCTVDSVINIALCTLGYIPGLLHAWYVISKYPEPEYQYEVVPDDEEHGYGGGGNGNVTYYYVSQRQQGCGERRQQQQQHQQQKYPDQRERGAMDYGTTNVSSGVGAPSAAGDARGYQGGSGEGQGQQQQQTGGGQEAGAEQGVPPSYDQAVKGDNKVQS